jgi:hypothetical protein
VIGHADVIRLPIRSRNGAMQAIFRSSLAILAFASLFSAIYSPGQAPSATQSATPQPIQEPDKTQGKKGTVILSRSIDENGQTVDGPAPAPPAAKPGEPTPSPNLPSAKLAAQLAMEDTERTALTYTDFDLDVRLRPAESRLAVRALLTLRNDGKTPLSSVRLQISSTLDWEQIRAAGRNLTFTVAVLNSDTDHTGQLHEAVVALPTPLAPGASAQLDVTYSGTVAQSAKRLQAIGTPEDAAAHSDWDVISTDFTGLRGFGNVVWYPVSSVPVILGDGARLFDEIGTHKRRLSGAHFRLALTVETTPATSPTIALVNGRPIPLTTTTAVDATVATIATASSEKFTLGFEAPSLFVASRASHAATNTALWARPESDPNVAGWITAADVVTPFLQSWLGMKPRSQLTVLDLPDDGDIPYETGALLATPIRSAGPEVLNGVLAHALTHAWVLSPRAWLSEGVAHFMGTLWIEKQQGRDRALASLDNARSALALAEPESPGEGEGQPLLSSISPAYYRTKAAYVFWMLRDLAGDTALSAALRAYDPAKDAEPDSFEKLIEQAGERHDLGWFFRDWVYTDKGLPDLSIESVYPTAASVPGSYLVAVNLANTGYTAVEAPVQVVSLSTTVTQRVMLAARSKSVQRILIQGIPTEVRLNNGTIPETQATVHSKTLDISASK